MTPTELRRMATDLLNDVGCAHAYKALADHILSTVREDDGEKVTGEWLTEMFNTSLYYGWIVNKTLCIWNTRKGHSLYTRDDPGADADKESMRICILKTRGQLRRLLEGLGVGQ